MHSLIVGLYAPSGRGESWRSLQVTPPLCLPHKRLRVCEGQKKATQLDSDHLDLVKNRHVSKTKPLPRGNSSNPPLRLSFNYIWIPQIAVSKLTDLFFWDSPAAPNYARDWLAMCHRAENPHQKKKVLRRRIKSPSSNHLQMLRASEREERAGRGW